MGESDSLLVASDGEVKTDLRSFFAWLPKHYNKILVGDSNHNCPTLLNFFSSHTFLGGLKEGGAGTIAREVQKDEYANLQDIFNKAPPKDFANDDSAEKIQTEAAKALRPGSLVTHRSLDRIYNTSAAIRSCGMEVAFVDTDPARQMIDYMKGRGVDPKRAETAARVGLNGYTQLFRLAECRNSKRRFKDTWDLICDKKLWLAIGESLRNPRASFAMLRHAVGISRQRIQESNMEIAENIKAIKSDAPKAIIFGEGHMALETKEGEKKVNLDELLGDGTVYVGVYKSEAAWKEMRKFGGFVADKFFNLKIREAADYLVFLDDNNGKGKIVKTSRLQSIPRLATEAEAQTEFAKTILKEKEQPNQKDSGDSQHFNR